MKRLFRVFFASNRQLLIASSIVAISFKKPVYAMAQEKIRKLKKQEIFDFLDPEFEEGHDSIIILLDRGDEQTLKKF
jgi:hypothetical protein